MTLPPAYPSGSGTGGGPADTDALPEGSVNLYYTDERAEDAIASTLVAGTNIGITYDDPANTLTITYTGAPPPADTDALPEGSTNLYFTDARAQSAASSIVRELLTADRTYFINAASGSDSNDGLSSGAAFATIGKAMAVAATLDLGGFAVTVELADGTYAESVSVPVLVGQTGVDKFVVQGNSTTPTNTIVSSSSGPPFDFSAGSSMTVNDVQLTCTATNQGCLHLADAGAFCSFSGVDFAAATGYHIFVSSAGSQVSIAGDYTISGGAIRHISVGRQGAVIVTTSLTCTVSGTPAFSQAFAYALQCGFGYFSPATYTGSATGKRYNVVHNSVIQAGSGGATKFPGDVSGTTGTGGQYI